MPLLELEAGLSENTMTTLRHAVVSGMALKQKHEMEKMAANTAVVTISAAAATSMAHSAPRTVKPASSKSQQLIVEEEAEIYSLLPRESNGLHLVRHRRRIVYKLLPQSLYLVARERPCCNNDLDRRTPSLCDQTPPPGFEPAAN